MIRPTTMSAKVEQYLKFRRSLGYRLWIEGQQLKQFAAFADAAGHRGPLTTALALRWARLPKGRDPLYWARRLEVVRCFARHLAATEPGTEVPARRLLGPAHRRTTPYIYSRDELASLVAAAGKLNPPGGLRPRTYATLIGLLACAGLRISEALHLTQADADLKDGVLKIRQTKFRKTRLVPLHPTAVASLRKYVLARDRLVAKTQCDRFFVSAQGLAIPYSTIRTVFRKLCSSLRITNPNRRRPRLHDLRHTFACQRVECWYAAGIDLAHAVSALSVYLGHAKVSDTYWYLTATPTLMARAAERFESVARPTTGEVRR